MSRTVRHLSLARIAKTELRVVADVEDDVMPLIQAEEAVVREYAQNGYWPHRSVTLFILSDLQPLARQLQAGAGPGGLNPPSSLSPGALSELWQRPMVSTYDLADLANCHVFVNHQIMMKEGYWSDELAMRGLLAHEHAHPLAENETTRLSRKLHLEVAFDSEQAGGLLPPTLKSLLARLAEKLCLFAPREIFSNALTIRRRFGQALLHLDRCNLSHAQQSIRGREGLRRRLEQEAGEGKITTSAAGLLLLVGDMDSYLDLALEVAPFYRMERNAEARQLESVLEEEVFPKVEPQVPEAYVSLLKQYTALPPNLQPAGLLAWGRQVVETLAKAVSAKGLVLYDRLWMVDD